LSQQKVIEASREFICIRPQTYENAEEAKVLASYFRGRSGQLENTVFCIFSPDGKTKLCRSGRSPKMGFRDSKDMASFMIITSSKYKPKKEITSLPFLEDVRLGLNVASCDLRPLVILFNPKKSAFGKMEKMILPLA
jgi:hypothetical protein